MKMNVNHADKRKENKNCSYAKGKNQTNEHRRWGKYQAQRCITG